MQRLAAAILAAVLLGGCASGMSRGSSRTLYTISGTLEVNRQDAGKDIQLSLDQQLFFHMDAPPDLPGRWSLISYDERILLMLSDTPRTGPGYWGVLFRAQAMGGGVVALRFSPDDPAQPPRVETFEVLVRR